MPAAVQAAAMRSGSLAWIFANAAALPCRIATRLITTSQPARTPASAPSNYLRSKAAGEDALRAAPLALTLLRPSVIFGARDRLLNLFAELQAIVPLVPLAGRWSGHERPVLPLPPAIGQLQALLMEWLPGTPLLSRDNLASLRVPNVASGTLPGLASLGIEATSLAQIAPGYLGRHVGRAKLDAMRARARRG
jgi:hypothetical protein